MRVLVASRNPGKLSEIRHLLEGLGLEVLSLDQAGVGPDFSVVEDGSSFEANARSKALALQKLFDGLALADDSGLEVDALGGAPGVLSARYAGFEGGGPERDRANVAKLLEDLSGVPDADRTARFVCVMALAGLEDRLMLSWGTCPGRIIHSPRGSLGFGYDPVFVPDGFERTLAELSLAEKNRISHRGRALTALLAKLDQRLGVL